MGKNRAKGCLMVCLQFVILGFIFLVVQIGNFLLPSDLAKVVISVVLAALITAVIVGNIYRIVMRRYYILAPSNPYEYDKMAQIKLTKDETIYVKKWLIRRT